MIRNLDNGIKAWNFNASPPSIDPVLIGDVKFSIGHFVRGLSRARVTRFLETESPLTF